MLRPNENETDSVPSGRLHLSQSAGLKFAPKSSAISKWQNAPASVIQYNHEVLQGFRSWGRKIPSPERYRAIYSNQPSTKTIEFLFAFKPPKK